MVYKSYKTFKNYKCYKSSMDISPHRGIVVAK